MSLSFSSGSRLPKSRWIPILGRQRRRLQLTVQLILRTQTSGAATTRACDTRRRAEAAATSWPWRPSRTLAIQTGTTLIDNSDRCSLLMDPFLGGRFGYFLFFSARRGGGGGGRGSPRSGGGGGGRGSFY